MDAATGKTFQLVVGLGNPGAEYAGTRHNVGFMIMDQLGSNLGFSFRRESRFRADVARCGGTWYAKPQTYMNLSGESVRALTAFYRIPPEAVLAVYDDAALPLGRLRFRQGGSAGGHNGMQSITDHLGTIAIPRLKTGIGGPRSSLTGHVLGRFSDEELPMLNETVARAAEAIEFAQAKGLLAAMNRFN